MNEAELARTRRKTLIDVARRRQRPGSGSLGLQMAQSAKFPLPELIEALKGLQWAVAGAVATSLYMPERATADVDIVVAVADADEAARRLTEAGFALQGALTIGGSTWRSPRGVSLDVIEGQEGWYGEALAAASSNLNGAGAPVLTLPYLVFMKLQASRMQDLADVTRMLGQTSETDLIAVRAVLTKYAPDLSEDLESLITLGQLERQSP
jgi:hypothetical protein